MKINMTDGTDLDTDILSDRDAEVHESLNKFYEVCRKYDIASFATVAMGKDKYLCVSTSSKQKSEKERINDYDTIFNSINNFIKESTDGKVRLSVEE